MTDAEGLKTIIGIAVFAGILLFGYIEGYKDAKREMNKECEGGDE